MKRVFESIIIILKGRPYTVNSSAYSIKTRAKDSTFFSQYFFIIVYPLVFCPFKQLRMKAK